MLLPARQQLGPFPPVQTLSCFSACVGIAASQTAGPRILGSALLLSLRSTGSTGISFVTVTPEYSGILGSGQCVCEVWWLYIVRLTTLTLFMLTLLIHKVHEWLGPD